MKVKKADSKYLEKLGAQEFIVGFSGLLIRRVGANDKVITIVIIFVEINSFCISLLLS